jgi:hypothetical protein
MTFTDREGLKMPETKFVDFQGKVPDAGPIHFLRAEWQVPRARFVVLRFSVEGKELPTGLRMDLDKKAILDDVKDVKDEAVNYAVKERADQIWQMVIDWRKEHRENYF